MDDWRRPTAAQATATAVCGLLLGALLFAARGRPAPTAVPPVLKVPAARPASKAAPPRAEPRIRVNLTPVPRDRLRIGVRGPFVVRSLESRRIVLRGERLDEVEVVLREEGYRFGKANLSREALEIASTTNALVAVNANAYHGTVRLYPQQRGAMTAVNVLPLENYVRCVIDAEMPAAFPPEARKAQAIVARTYALWQMERADPAAKYDVFATVRSQKYLGAEYTDAKGRRLAGESASSRDAAAATRAEVCHAGGRLFCTYYSAVCGGATTPGRDIFADADPALRSVPCTWCRDSDKYRWQTELTAEQLLAAVRRTPEGKGLSAIRTVRQVAGPQAGIISRFEISDGRKSATLSGMAIRQECPSGTLLSPHFSLTVSRGKVQAAGHGFGHGAGFCQWGARGLAKSGRSAEEIVRYYYPGATIVQAGY